MVAALEGKTEGATRVNPFWKEVILVILFSILISQFMVWLFREKR